MFIYLDEAGDLGFDLTKPGTSRYFVITLLVCDTLAAQTGFHQAVRRTLKNKLNPKKNKSRVVNELKGTKTTLSIKKYFYRDLPESGWGLYSVVLNKSRVFSHLQTKVGKKRLYNFLTKFILDKLQWPGDISTVNLVVDQSKNKLEQLDFNRYLESHLYDILSLKTKLFITHEMSDQNLCLQAVDMFCWGIFRKYNNRDQSWYGEFKNNLRLDEDVYLP